MPAVAAKSGVVKRKEIIMSVKKFLIRAVLVCICGCALVCPVVSSVAGVPSGSGPAVIQDGFASWLKGGVDSALYVWKNGGLLEGGNKVSTLSSSLKSVASSIGTYKSYETLQIKPIGKTSEVVYVSVNCERGALFARFLLYRTDKDWVVQDVVFSVKPEAIMPWLAFEGEKEAE
jgi:hypothetical protein